jgi:hypothetical protein
VITDLFAVVSGIDSEAVARAIPPTCRRELSTPPNPIIKEGEVLLEFPEWRPRVPSRHVVPSLSMLTDAPYVTRFELSAWSRGTWSPWIASATIGQGLSTWGAAEGPADALACDIDVYTSAGPLERLRLRIRVGSADPKTLVSAPWMATLSACDLAPLASEAVAPPTPRLPVPALSQMDAPPEIALRICSPTSVAMVLDYWGVRTALLPLAADVFHAKTDRYGVWPAAIQAAGRRGVPGYLLRFPDWSSAAWCLERKLPIIASVAYAAGELTDAPIPETSGHLIVLTGSDTDHVFVNDPIAPTTTTVPRRYRLDQLQRAWLHHTGIGYILFNPDDYRI